MSNEIQRPSPPLTARPNAVQVLTKPLAPLPPVINPSPKLRRWAPDLTGFWEARPSSGPNVNSPLLVQINQAGGAIVLWFTRPPSEIEGVDIVYLPDLSANNQTGLWAYGIASAFVRDIDGTDLLSNGAQLIWIAVRKPVADKFNILDLSHLYKPPKELNVLEGNGKLRINGSEIIINFDDRRPGIPLVRIRPGARLPRTVISDLPEPLKTLMLIDNVLPIPSTLEKRMLSLFAPEWENREPRLAPRLRAWRGAPITPPSQRDLIRSQIANELSFGCEEPWRSALLDRMSLAARTNFLKLGDTTQTYSDWLTEVLDDEEQVKRPQRDKESQRVQEAIRAIGIGMQTFAYTFTFSDYGQKSSKPGIGLGGYVFDVSIIKESLTILKDNQGHIKYEESGRPEVNPTSRKLIPWQDSSDPLMGVFGRIEASLAVGDSKDSEHKTSRDTADLGKLEFRSSLDLTGTNAFKGAIFTISSVVLGEAKFGNWAKASIIDSSLWELRLASDGRMSAIVTGEPKGPSITNIGKLGTRKWWNDWKPDKVDIKLGRLSLGIGYITTLSIGKSLKIDKAQQTTQKQTAFLISELDSFFEYDSFLLEDSKWPETRIIRRRMRLEESVAAIRGIIALSGPHLILIGLTSPEGDDDYNRVLSKNRAITIEQALRDALGPIYSRPPAIIRSLGELPSTSRGQIEIDDIIIQGGNLPDPESSPTYYTSAEGRRRKTVEWPQWRRVEIHVEGYLLIRFYTKNDPSPT